MPPTRLRGGALRGPAACTLAALAITATAVLAGQGTTRDRPPPAHTGAFGEPSCHFCHDDAAPNSGGGSLRITGIPDAPVAGKTYPIALELDDTRLRAAGFQLAVRFTDGTQAGTLAAAPHDAERIAVTIYGDIAYAHHLYEGTDVATRGSARWIVEWTAPAVRDQDVVFSAAAVAADNDLSNLGDLVYTTSVPAEPPPRR